MKEINEAYDEIQRQRKSGGSGYGQQSYGGGYQQSYGGYQRNYGGYQQSYGGSSQFADIRRLINLNRLGDAEELLDGISASARTAEWNYLKGIVNYRKGWLDNAVTYLNTACAMEPSNMEYRQALNQLTQQQRAMPRRAAPVCVRCALRCTVPMPAANAWEVAADAEKRVDRWRWAVLLPACASR